MAREAQGAISRAERIQIAAEATCDERSVIATYAGRSVRSTTQLRIVEAAKRLGLPLPDRQEDVGQTPVPMVAKPVRLSSKVWGQVEARAKRDGMNLHAALREAALMWLQS